MDYYKIDNINNQYLTNNIEDQYQISINDMLKEINLYFYAKSDKVNIFTDEMLLKKYLKEHNIDYEVNNQIKGISENTEKTSFNVSKTKLLLNIENATKTTLLNENNLVNVTKKMNLK